jgi:SAM-dependent methyltransferase
MKIVLQCRERARCGYNGAVFEVKNEIPAYSGANLKVAYLFGHSQTETDRLLRQAKMFGPYTRRLFEDAGISLGMKVLDVGSGAGDVAFIVADIVGRDGTVVGIDTNAELLATARQRGDAAGLKNVTFRVGDVASVSLDHYFDAVVGRCVLFFIQDRLTVLRPLEGKAHRRVVQVPRPCACPICSRNICTIGSPSTTSRTRTSISSAIPMADRTCRTTLSDTVSIGQ